MQSDLRLSNNVLRLKKTYHTDMMPGTSAAGIKSLFRSPYELLHFTLESRILVP